METFAEAREFVPYRRYAHARQTSIGALDFASIEDPIRDVVEGFAAFPQCFTLQCCFGHFLCSQEQDSHSLEPIPAGFSGFVNYRIAYVALCIEDSIRGKALRESLARIPAIDPGFIQFGSADWFWERWPNSYVLQVEPEAYKLQDEAILEPAEALCTQSARDLFFTTLRSLLAAELKGY